MDNLSDTISLYRDQLVQVDGFLTTDPSNQQFLSLRNDLIKAITLTNELLNATTNSSQILQSSTSSNNNSKNTFNGKEKDATCDDEYDIESSSDNEQEESAPLPAKIGAITVGEVVIVSGGDRPYAGVLVELKIDTAECVIKYFEHVTEVILPLISISRVDPGFYNTSDISVGMKYLCKYSADQIYYEAEIISKSKYGFNVTFTEYGNSEEVPLEYLKPLPIVTTTASNKKNVEKKIDDGLELIKVPEKLKILPTDTEEEKNRKKKRLKKIKNHNRIVEQELEIKATQQTWKSFVTKGSKRSLTGLVKSSIFASSDTVDGKVGVVNSGKGLTDFAQRKKNRF